MQRPVTLAFNIVMIGGLAYLAFTRSNQSTHSPSNTPVGEQSIDTAQRASVDQDQQIALLRQQLAKQDQKLSELLAERAKREDQAASEAATERHAPDPRDPAVIKAQKEQWHAHMAEVQANFFMEKHDAKWAATMLTVIRTIAEKNEAIRDAVETIECHSQTCRVEIKQEGSGKASQQLPMFVQQVGSDLPKAEISQVEDEHGQKKTVVYFSQSSPGA